MPEYLPWCVPWACTRRSIHMSPILHNPCACHCVPRIDILPNYIIIIIITSYCTVSNQCPILINKFCQPASLFFAADLPSPRHGDLQTILTRPIASSSALPASLPIATCLARSSYRARPKPRKHPKHFLSSHHVNSEQATTTHVPEPCLAVIQLE